MKISIAAAILILAIAVSLGWRDHQRLVAVREHHTKLVAEAATLGIALDSTNPADPIRITKRERENREADAKLAAAELIAFAKEMEAMEKNGNSPDEAMQKRIMELMDRMMSLDSTQLKIVIAELRATADLKDETRNNLIGFSIMTLANDHPQAALALFTESSDLFKDSGMGNHVVSSSLAKWAKDDPMAALEWVRKNGERFPDLVTDDAKRGMISGTAVKDPKLAFQLIGELGLKDTSQAISGIMSAAKTPADRTATLGALRDHFATLPDEKARDEATAQSMGGLTRGLAQEGFTSATRWIDGANLSPTEFESITGGLSYFVKSDETGQWIEWLGEKLPPEKPNANIRNIVRNWTENDYQAAGKWLATAPDGPAKNASIRTYAETVSKYEPETAAQWAMTLPPGKDRDETLKRIHENWPKDDTAAKEAFAKEHGIK
jgi:hypothetical protein